MVQMGRVREILRLLNDIRKISRPSHDKSETVLPPEWELANALQELDHAATVARKRHSALVLTDGTVLGYSMGEEKWIAVKIHGREGLHTPECC